MSADAPSGPPAVPDWVRREYNQLEAKVRAQRPTEDLAALRQAFEFAAERHANQTRKTGEPYITHPLAVAGILADMSLDLVALETGLLHDVAEDTGTKIEEIRRRFGPEVAHCVDGVTKLTKAQRQSREERQAESMRKMLLAMVSDIRVIMVKLADRLHNLRTLEAMEPDKRQRIANETLELYVPIAHRLGMGKLRGELEDMSFRHAEPEAAAELERQMASRLQASEEPLRELRATVMDHLAAEGIPARVESRVKRVYSVYQKLKRQKISLEQVYDILGLRIITDSVKNCYSALGVIHGEWPPIPGRIKDYIAIPRPNLYQSLHTSVVGPAGHSFEVQIRTEEMHRIAEEGIAAHWKYKEGKKGPAEDDQRIAWLRQLVDWQRDLRDPNEFMSTFKGEVFQEEVYCFTPKGKVIVLPKDSTPIDFAYAIHSDVGHSCVGAKVNQRIVPLRTALRSGDMVEILTQSGHQPSKDWLNLVKTSRARNRIRQVINATERERAVEIGAKALEREARRLGVSLGKIGREELERVALELGCSRVEDLHAALGYGKYSARQVLQRFAPEEEAERRAARPETADREPAEPGAPPPVVDKDLVVQVKGVEDVMVYLSKCCNPIHGEPIVGYISRGKGVGVHATRCPNVQNLVYERERQIEVGWTKAGHKPFEVHLRVYSEDRPGMLHQITTVLNQENSNIRSLEAKPDQKRGVDTATVEMAVEIKDKKQLERIVAAMRRISGIRDVERTQ